MTGRREAKKETARAAMQAGMRLELQINGYRDACLDACAEAAGMSIRSLYRYYDTKDRLVFAALRVPTLPLDSSSPDPDYSLVAALTSEPGFVGALVEHIAGGQVDLLVDAARLAADFIHAGTIGSVTWKGP